MVVTQQADSQEEASGVFDREDPPVLGANAFVGLTRRQIAAAFGRLLQRVVVEPRVATALAVEAARELGRVVLGRSDVTADPKDKRFADPAWTANPFYHRVLQAYLLERRALWQLVDKVQLTPKSRERARFAMSLLTEAAAPTNTLVGNPTALARARHTRGHSLVDGFRHFGGDLRHNGGMPSMVDTRPFELGVNLAVTPGQVVHRTEVFELIQYEPTRSQTFARPLVVIPPQINKYYISDIAPGRSLVEHTVASGIPYFAISWRNPTAAQRDWGLDAYVAACREALEVACAISRADDTNVAGVCAGGITLACLLGHLAATPAARPFGDVDGLRPRHLARVHRRASRLTSHHRSGPRPLATRRGPRRQGPRQDVRVAPIQRFGVELLGQQLLARPGPACVRYPLLERRHHQSACPAALGFPRPLRVEWAGSPRHAPGARHLGGFAPRRLRRLRRGRHDRSHRPVDRRLPDHPAPRRGQRVRPQLQRAHPGHSQPARQQEGGVPDPARRAAT
jgi:Poly-beta-hydroxybutyrate polymerase (PhaC) N-terminus